MTKNVVVIAPHPDDETLGCGGTLLKHKSVGDKIFWLIITNITDEKRWGKDRINERQKEIEIVASNYKFEEVFKLNIETTQVDRYPFGAMVERISSIIKMVQPQIVYIHNRSDIHSDHQLSFKAAMSSIKIFNNPFLKKILMYETLSETNFSPPFFENAFLPNYYVDISEFIEKKIEIMKIYKTELGLHPFPRSEESIKSLAVLRGSEAGVKYAEAFMLIKEIW